jgi:hypothetical protein
MGVSTSESTYPSVLDRGNAARKGDGVRLLWSAELLRCVVPQCEEDVNTVGREWIHESDSDDVHMATLEQL